MTLGPFTQMRPPSAREGGTVTPDLDREAAGAAHVCGSIPSVSGSRDPPTAVTAEAGGGEDGL